MKRILVAYATMAGSTVEVARAVGEEIAESGVQDRLQSPNDKGVIPTLNVVKGRNLSSDRRAPSTSLRSAQDTRRGRDVSSRYALLGMTHLTPIVWQPMCAISDGVLRHGDSR